MEAAQAYASAGALGRSNAFPGQLVRILPESSDDEPTLYIIDSRYQLVSSTENIATDSKLSVNFGFNSISGSSAVTIIVPAGFVLNQITVKFNEGFMNDDAIIVASRRLRSEDGETPQLTYLLGSGSDPTVTASLGTSNIIITDEDNSEFAIQSTMTFNEKTSIILFINTKNDPLQRGSGILKLN